MIFYDSNDKRKKYVRVFFIAAAAIVFSLILSLTFDMFFLLRKDPKPLNIDIAKSYKYYYTKFNDKKLSITFDDGPNPLYTEKAVAILKKHNVPATFFFIGQNILKYPSIAKEVADAGYEIGNHTFTHSEEINSSPQRLENELRTTRKMIELTTSKEPLFYRPPFLVDIGPDPTINPDIPLEEPLLFAFSEGYIPVGADVDSKDWLVKTPEELSNNVLNGARAGGHIILLHDGGGDPDTEYMLQVLEDMIVTLKAEGYTFVPLRELLLPKSSIAVTTRLSLGATDSANSKEVSSLQWFLYTESFLGSESLNGKFDTATLEALKNWQLSKGIVDPNNLLDPEYGVTGEKTRNYIAKASEDVGVNGGISMQQASVWSIGDVLQRINLRVLSFLFAMSKYLFWAVIFLVVGRISAMLGFFAFSVLKNKSKNAEKHEDYTGGVTVLIPGFNEEENIASTIRSVLNNDYPNKEIIVINDGSTDNTAEVVRGVQAKYPGKITLLDIPNGGKANALNIGIEHASHEVFVAMDADTVFAKDTIRNLVRHMGDKTVGAVAGKVATTKSKNMLDIFQSIEYVVGQNIEKRVFSYVNAVGVIPGPVGAWRKQVVMNCGGYSTETLVEDQDLTLAINTAGYKIIYEPLALAYTETPHTLKDFLKQRFRWVYGTFQCMWKYKSFIFSNPLSSFSLVIVPNIVIFSLLVPLFYPIVDLVLLVSIFTGSWQQVLYMYILFTVIDVVYSSVGFIGEKEGWKRLFFVPIQRLYYRQVIYYVVTKAFLWAMEGGEALWNKVAKNGDSQRYYFARLEVPAVEGVVTEPIVSEVVKS